MSASQPREGLPPTNLASVFTTDRAGGLRGRLAPVASPPPAQRPPTAEPAAAEPASTAPAVRPPDSPPAAPAPPGRVTQAESKETPQAQPARDPRPKTRTTKPAASDTSDGGTKQGVIYMPLSLRERLHAHRRETGRTVTEVLLDAFDATHQRLPDLYAAQAPTQQQNSLFDRPASRRRGDTTDPVVQVFFSTTARNLAVIDDITAKVAHGSNRARSRVATLALDAHLPPLS